MIRTAESISPCVHGIADMLGPRPIPKDFDEMRVQFSEYATHQEYLVKKVDELDTDVLVGAGVGLTAAATTEVLPGLTLASGTQRRGRVQLMGRYWLYVSHASAAVTGVADLYLLHPKHTM